MHRPTMAADELPALSPLLWSVWVGAAVVVHLIWGFHPVFSRWLQTRAAVPVDGINLLGVCQLLALLINLSVVSIRSVAARCAHCRGSDGCDSSGKSKEREETISAASVSRNTCTQRKHVLYAGLIGLAYATRAATNIVSSSFTAATNIALIQLAAPFVNGVASWLILRERVDRSLAYAVVASTIGVTVAVVGQAETQSISLPTSSESGQLRPAFGWIDTLGMMIQAISLLFSTAQRILMRTSKDLFEPLQFTRIQYCATILVCGTWSLSHGSSVWEPWKHLNSTDWLAAFGLAVGVFFFGSTGQVAAIRRLGLGTYACLQPTRMIGSAIGSAIILGEPVTGAIEWLGLVMVMGATMAYAVHQRTTAVRTSNQSYEMIATRNDSSSDEDELLRTDSP